MLITISYRSVGFLVCILLTMASNVLTNQWTLPPPVGGSRPGSDQSTSPIPSDGMVVEAVLQLLLKPPDLAPSILTVRNCSISLL